MKDIIIKNETKNNIVVTNGKITTNFYDRFMGLMGKSKIEKDEALIIDPCKSIHMFFMKFSIDAVFLDDNNKVCHIVECINPWNISKVIKEAKCVIEFKCGKVKTSSIDIGDLLTYEYK